MKKLKLGFMQGRLSSKIRNKIQAFPFDNWENEFKIAKDINFKIMEWTIDDYKYKHNPIMCEKGKKRIKILKERFDLKINSITCDFLMTNCFFKKRYVEKKDEKNFYDFLNNCKEVNIKTIVVPLVDKSSIKNSKEAKNIISFFNNLESFLFKNKMEVAFESDLRFNKLSKFIDYFNPKVFGINYDIGNSAGLHYDYKKEMKSYFKRIINVHIKDKNKKNLTVPLFSGRAQIIEVIKYLIDRGYEGNFILQPARTSHDHINMIKNYGKIFKNYAF